MRGKSHENRSRSAFVDRSSVWLAFLHSAEKARKTNETEKEKIPTKSRKSESESERYHLRTKRREETSGGIASTDC